MNELQIGMGKSARRGYRLADLSIQPSRRTRTPAEVDTSWQIDALRFDSPIVADPPDGVVTPHSAIETTRAGRPAGAGQAAIQHPARSTGRYHAVWQRAGRCIPRGHGRGG